MKYYMSEKYPPYVKEVEVQKTTESSVWINGHRENKVSEYRSYHPSAIEAIEHLIQKQFAEVEMYKRYIHHYQAKLDEMESIKNNLLAKATGAK